MPIPGAETPIGSWSTEQARDAAFDAPPVESGWERPGAALVSARLCGLISGRRRRDRRVEGLEADLYQEVYEDLWKRFDHIWQRFLASRRALRWSAFEAYLHVSLQKSLANAIRKLCGRREPQEAIPIPLADPGPGPALDARHLVARALASLTGDERDALLDDHLRGRSAADTARRLGLTRAAVYGLRHSAYRRFRNAVIRQLGEEILRVRGSGPMRAVVSSRCSDAHPCWVFKLDCAKARSPDQIAQIGGMPSAVEASDGLAQLVEAIADAVEQAGLVATLDACFWETRRPGPEDADHE